MIPNTTLHGHYLGHRRSLTSGGEKIAAVAKFASDFGFAISDDWNMQASQSAKTGSYARREQDWTFQSNLAAGESSQIFKQIRGAEIRQAIAEMELKNHRQQMKHAEEIERFLNEGGTGTTGKKTNKSLYAWHELGAPNLSYLQVRLPRRQGGPAGEKLFFDIKRMEMAYHDLNQREYKLTRHVSVLQVNPLALLQLRASGRCTVALPETLFDPAQEQYPQDTEPGRPSLCARERRRRAIHRLLRRLQSIVTSSAQNDGGLFETNLRDERYLPFENSGVVSEWQLDLPANPSKGDTCQFDYQTISDVILHIRYTAREVGGRGEGFDAACPGGWHGRRILHQRQP